jgi:hypothetical protein
MDAIKNGTEHCKASQSIWMSVSVSVPVPACCLCLCHKASQSIFPTTEHDIASLSFYRAGPKLRSASARPQSTLLCCYSATATAKLLLNEKRIYCLIDVCYY